MRTISSPNFSIIGLYLPELLPKKNPKWAQLCPEPQKNSGSRKVNSRMKNSQKLKVVDPETMEKCACFRACEIFFGPFRLAPGGNLGPFFQIGPKRTNNFQGLPNFWHNYSFEIFFFFFFFKIVSIKFCIWKCNYFFLLAWGNSQKWAQSWKRGFLNKKILH